MGMMRTQTVPSGRTDERRARPSLAAGLTLLGLGVLGLLGTPIGILAPVALVGLGGIMMLTGETVEKHPPTMSVP